MVDQTFLKETLNYNAELGQFYWAYTRGSRARKDTKAGTVARTGYLQIQLNKKIYLAHQLVWLWETGSFPAEPLTHINGNKLDNRFENLQLISTGRLPTIVKDWAEVPLACGSVALIDIPDIQAVAKHRWCLSNNYPSTRIDTKLVYLHTFLLGAPPNGLVTDHVNRNKLDNRRENLRHTTQSVNCRNSDYFENYTGPLHAPGGVGRDNTHNRFKSYFTVLGSRVNVGTFKTYEEAEAARAAAYAAYLESIGEGDD